MVMDEKGLARLLLGLKGIFEKVIDSHISFVDNFQLNKNTIVLNGATYDSSTDTIYMSDDCEYNSELEMVVFSR